MARHFSNFKKYSTSASYMGFHFWGKDDRSATRCPLSDCPWIAETSNDKFPELIGCIREHIEYHKREDQ